MATINITKTGNITAPYVTELVADTAADVPNLPVQPEVATGSTCFIIATGDVYMLNSVGSWIKL